MKLNVDILKESLSDVIPLKQHGQSCPELRLTRPLLYDGKSVFKENNVYISSFDFLPEAPDLEDGTVIICLAKEVPEAYYANNCILLLLDTTKSIHNVFNIVQKTFDKYDEWDASLQQITMERNKLSSLLDVSDNVLENPLFILDKNLKVIANSASYDEKLERNKKLNFINDESLIKSSAMKATSNMDKVFVCNKYESSIMFINLFKDNKFIGRIYIKEDHARPLRTSDQGLLLHLKRYVNFLLHQYNEILSVDNNLMKVILKKILDGEILNDTRLLKEIRLNHNKQDRYMCIKFKLEENNKVIPTQLICEQIEETLPDTIAMVYQNVIVAFMKYRFPASNPISEGPILINFLQAKGYKAGISEEFTDIFQARYYFNEACAAIDIGYPLNSELEVYYFKDYVKEYILSMITSEIPPEMVCAKGLLRLLDHDKLNNTSYYNELRTYINYNMNAVQAAKNLYMHRNTLLVHLAHIYKLIGVNLDDPEDRMYVQLSYKLLEREGVYKSLSYET